MAVHQLGVASEAVRHEVVRHEAVTHKAMAERSRQSCTDDLWPYEAERVDLERRAWSVWAGDQDARAWRLPRVFRQWLSDTKKPSH